MLAAADTWLLPQPKAVALSGESFDLKKCKGIRLVGCDDPRLKTDFPALLQERCGIRLKASTGKPGRGCISLVLCPHEMPPPGVKSLTPRGPGGPGRAGLLPARGPVGHHRRRGDRAGASTTRRGRLPRSPTAAPGCRA